MLEPELINDIIRRVLEVTDTKKIILFGSAVAGTMTPDSDIDLLVVKTVVTNMVAEINEIRKALKGLHYPFDIFVMSADEFEITKNIVGGLAWPAYHRGKLLYYANAATAPSGEPKIP